MPRPSESHKPSGQATFRSRGDNTRRGRSHEGGVGIVDTSNGLAESTMPWDWERHFEGIRRC
jgi:hypothetical protein